MGCYYRLQGIFPTQGSNSCLPLWQAGSLPVSYLRSPEFWNWVFLLTLVSYPLFFQMLCFFLCFAVSFQRSHGLFLCPFCYLLMIISYYRLPFVILYYLRNDDFYSPASGLIIESTPVLLPIFQLAFSNILNYAEVEVSTSFHASLLLRIVRSHAKLQFPSFTQLFLFIFSWLFLHQCLPCDNHS